MPFRFLFRNPAFTCPVCKSRKVQRSEILLIKVCQSTCRVASYRACSSIGPLEIWCSCTPEGDTCDQESLFNMYSYLDTDFALHHTLCADGSLHGDCMLCMCYLRDN